MHPYKNLDYSKFWKRGVFDKKNDALSDIVQPKFKFNRQTSFATYGSCFAQNIGKYLVKNNFNWVYSEKHPPGLINDIDILKFGYKIFSSRTGNIYTTSLFKQWVDWSFGIKKIPSEFWQEKEGIIDPFRPSIPAGLISTKVELEKSRKQTLLKFKESLLNCDVLVFTLGLTECWLNKRGYEYPNCPGTIGGKYDEEIHYFHNHSYQSTYDNLLNAINTIKKVNKNIRILLTVSPVPLTATYSNDHVLTATVKSKSILRSVADEICKHDYIDYFPSFEMFTSHITRGKFFENNLRSPNDLGVQTAMKIFGKKYLNLKNSDSDETINENIICEEELLESIK